MRNVRLSALLLAAALAGCQALPEKPVRQTMFDFGPATAAPEGGAPQRAALLLQDVETRGVLETPQLLYRLAYEDAHELRPYAYARWSAPPGQLLRQRLREVIGRERPVLDTAAAAALSRRGGNAPAVLRVDLEEFSHVFDAPGSSRGVLRVRCTLLENTGNGERLLAQRSFEAQRPAPSADPAGGVRALAAAADAVSQEVAAWLRQH